MLNTLAEVGMIGFATLMCIFIMSTLFSARILIKFLIESALMILIVCTIAVNIIYDAESLGNYAILGIAGIITCVCMWNDWRRYRRLKAWFF